LGEIILSPKRSDETSGEDQSTGENAIPYRAMAGKWKNPTGIMPGT
jgi:hypothetical protein